MELECLQIKTGVEIKSGTAFGIENERNRFREQNRDESRERTRCSQAITHPSTDRARLLNFADRKNAGIFGVV
ncbi:hypothetical protein EVAR_26791_1 [Eumeta japonica]|uniref:Uncharacterized protein n=1 Tax=Eumeta variegata TaxID=151549 RepID=A0A4C1WDF7_EUMVA|nr:hypothetical protein EVAR_26791_1 [Eumeta japonica]